MKRGVTTATLHHLHGVGYETVQLLLLLAGTQQVHVDYGDIQMERGVCALCLYLLLRYLCLSTPSWNGSMKTEKHAPKTGGGVFLPLFLLLCRTIFFYSPVRCFYCLSFLLKSFNFK